MKLSKTIIVLFVIISFIGCTKSKEKAMTATELNQEAIVLLTDLDKMDIDKALEHLNEAIRLDPNFVDAYLNRAQAHLYLDKSQQAFDDFDRAIQIKPNSAEAYFRRGKAYQSLEKEEQAFEDFDKVIQLDPNRADVFYERGEVYASLGVNNKAFEDFGKALSINPNHIMAKMSLVATKPFVGEVTMLDDFNNEQKKDEIVRKDKIIRKDRYIDNNDGTVIDTFTGNVWQKRTAETRNWDHARSYCEGLALGGYNDWIIPERDTLLSLNISGNKVQGISKVFETKRWGYWTSSSSMEDKIKNKVASVVYDTRRTLDDGYVGIGVKTNKNADRYVRCIRERL